MPQAASIHSKRCEACEPFGRDSAHSVAEVIMTVSHRSAAALAAVAAFAATALPASAQATSTGKWEVEVHGGFASATSPDGGSAGTLPAATPLFTSPFSLPSQRISSWFFGDGTTLINSVNATLAPGSRLTAIDPVITSSIASRDSGANFGVRIARRIGSRYFAEATVDLADTPLTFSQEALDGIEASRATFVTAFRGLLLSGFSAPNVTGTVDLNEGSGRELITTGVFGVDLLTHGRLIPYVVGGAGIAHGTGDQPSATITGNYTIPIPVPDVTPINETDTLKIRVMRDANAAVGVFGGGFRYAASSRWGVRFDVRASVGGGASDVVIDATPSVLSGPVGALAASPTIPSAVFSSSILRSSSLSGPAISGLKTFSGSGSSVRSNVVGGVYVRF
jgi:hypothetical protein